MDVINNSKAMRMQRWRYRYHRYGLRWNAVLLLTFYLKCAPHPWAQITAAFTIFCSVFLWTFLLIVLVYNASVPFIPLFHLIPAYFYTVAAEESAPGSIWKNALKICSASTGKSILLVSLRKYVGLFLKRHICRRRVSARPFSRAYKCSKSVKNK